MGAILEPRGRRARPGGANQSVIDRAGTTPSGRTPGSIWFAARSPRLWAGGSFYRPSNLSRRCSNLSRRSSNLSRRSLILSMRSRWASPRSALISWRFARSSNLSLGPPPRPPGPFPRPPGPSPRPPGLSRRLSESPPRPRPISSSSFCCLAEIRWVHTTAGRTPNSRPTYYVRWPDGVKAARLRHRELLDLAPELDRRSEVLFDAPDGALALFVLFEHPDLVHEGGLLHLGDVGDDEDLAEGPLEALEG